MILNNARALLRIGIPLFLLTYSSLSFSFKVDSHVWIAQEIIDDLKDDGKITVVIGGVTHTIAPPQQYVDAILAYQGEFKAGAVGPDASPDILIGQMLIHPGGQTVQGSILGTDAWLKLMLKEAKYPNEIAYVLGYMVHASSDLFAHTYANSYGGGVFTLTVEGTENEKRHLLLESFIAKLTPRLSTQQQPYDGLKFPSIKDSLGGGGGGGGGDPCQPKTGHKIPVGDCQIPKNASKQTLPTVDFMERMFFYTPADVVESVRVNGSRSAVKYPPSIQRYRDAGAFGGHLTAIYALRYRLEQLAQSPELLEMDKYITKAVVYYWTDYMPTDSEALKINEWHQRVKELEYNAQERIQRVKNEVEDFVSKSTIRLNTHVVDTVRNIETNLNKLHAINYRINDLDYAISRWENELFGLHCRISLDPVCDKIKKLKKKINDAKYELNAKIIEFTSTRTATANALQDLFSFAQTVDFVRRDIDNTVTDLAQVLMKDVNPIRALLKNWSGGIDAAMVSYRPVGLAMMQEAMKDGGNAIAPLKKWAFTDCNLIKLLGSGDEVGGSVCKLTRSVKQLMDEINNLKPLLGSAGNVYIADVHRAINELVDKEVAELKAKLVDRLVTRALNEIAPSLADFVETLRRGIDDAGLNTEFAATDSNAPNYLLIGDIAARVRAEMRVTTVGCNGKSQCFDKQRYPVVRNAISLSKMVLLDGNGLNQLATLSGMTNQWLYETPADITDSNILFGAIRSIDGDHQWYGDVTPPYPTRAFIDINANPALRGWVQSKYGYNEPGLKIWRNSEARNAIFNRVFIGPMNEGLFTPRSLGNFSDLLSANYRSVFNSCRSVPFPIDNSRDFCAGEIDNPPTDGSGPAISAWSTSTLCTAGDASIRSTITSSGAARYMIEVLVGSSWELVYDGNSNISNFVTYSMGPWNLRARASNGTVWGPYTSKTIPAKACDFR